MSTPFEAFGAGLAALLSPPTLLLLPYFASCGSVARGGRRRGVWVGVAFALVLALLARLEGLAPLRATTPVGLVAAALVLALVGLLWRFRQFAACSALALTCGLLWLPQGLGSAQSALRGAWPSAAGRPLGLVMAMTLGLGAVFLLGWFVPRRRFGLLVMASYALAALSGLLSWLLRWSWLHWPLPLGG